MMFSCINKLLITPRHKILHTIKVNIICFYLVLGKTTGSSNAAKS